MIVWREACYALVSEGRSLQEHNTFVGTLGRSGAAAGVMAEDEPKAGFTTPGETGLGHGATAMVR